MRLSTEEVANEIARLEHKLGRNYKVIDLARPLAELEAEITDESDREYLRYVKAHGPAQIALVFVGRLGF